MACKIKGRASNVCKFKDALTPILEQDLQKAYDAGKRMAEKMA